MSVEQAKLVAIKLLLVEDSPDDAELVHLELRRGGYDVGCQQVQTEDAMKSAIHSGEFDLVISDYSMPDFDGMRALATLRASGVDVPFIMVSGSIGDDLAVEAMRAGASDYMLKRDLRRLCPAVQRELREAASRREARRANSAAAVAAEALEIRERVVEHMPIGVTVFEWTDRNDLGSFRVLWQNEAAKRFAKHDTDVVGKTLNEIRPAVVRTAFTSALASAVDRNEVTELPEFRYSEDRLRDAVWQVKVVPLGRQLVGALFSDITQQVRLEQQMRAAQRLEAVGRLAGGVAHDFNNVLTVIESYAGFLFEQFREGDPVREDIATIRDATKRAATLTGQLLAFSRRQPHAPIALNLNETIRDLERMLRRIIGEDVVLHIDGARPLGSVMADPSQVEQVLMNLAVNARDAMPKGGDLTVRTSEQVLADPKSGLDGSQVPPGSYVMLSVTDTGTGMDEELVRHIFEPFFTTKEQGRGTGLGLSTVYGIVRQSGGHILIDTALGRGTTFEIYLPRHDAAPAVVRARVQRTPVGGTETVLLVEDEELVRKAAARILKSAGYRILQASHGAEALWLAETHSAPLDLLITDIVMPNVGGIELASRLVPARPEMSVIYMSGYSADDLAQLAATGTFLQKPFSANGLLLMVRDVLDQRAEAL